MAMNTVTNIANLTPATGFLLIIFFIAANSVSLKKKGVRFNSAQKSTVKIRGVYLLLAGLQLVFVIEIFRPLYGFSMFPEVATNVLFNSNFLRVAGVLAIFFSVYLMKTTLQHFGASLRFGLNEINVGKLVTTGVFARSRNPFFLSLLLFFTGTALTFPSLFFIAFAIAAFAGIHFSILKEERFLLKVYGDEYREYRCKVRRYF